MPEEPKVAVVVVQLLLAAAGSMSLDRRELLLEAGIDELTIADRDERVELAVQARLGKAILRRIPGRSFAVALAGLVTPSGLGAIGEVIRHSPSLLEALRAFGRYAHLLADCVDFRFSPLDGGARLQVQAPPLYTQLGHPTEALLAMTVALSRSVTGEALRPRGVELQHGPLPSSAELEDYLGAPVRYHAPGNAVLWNDEALALPVVGARADRHATFVAHADSLLRDIGECGAWSRQAYQHLARQLPQGVPTQAAVARAMRLSPRTMSRRLQAEGTSFTELVEQLRWQLAKHHLSDPTLTAHEVALLLGYEEPSTFFKAFKRWSGTTPGRWRSQQRDADGH